MILDFLMILLVAVFVFIGYRTGIVKAFYSIISLIFAGFISRLLSGFLAQWVYDTFFATNINNSISNTLTNATANTVFVTENTFTNLPDYVTTLFKIFGVDNESLFRSIEKTGSILAYDVQNAVMSAVVSIFTTLIFILLFILLLIVFKMLSKYILSVFKIPVIKQINGLLGGLLGLIEGLIICYIAVLICGFILPIISQPLISDELISQSLFFAKIYYSDFLGLVSNCYF